MADFKKWMVKHDYDPEHGKNMPSQAGTADGCRGCRAASGQAGLMAAEL